MADHQHNDPLEEFFKKKAREYDIEYNEADWQKLERRLDAADEKRSTHIMRYTAAAAIILLFSLLAYITYQQQLKINQLNERITNSRQVEHPQDFLTDLLPSDLFQFTIPENIPDQIDAEEVNPNAGQEVIDSNDDPATGDSQKRAVVTNKETPSTWHYADNIERSDIPKSNRRMVTNQSNAGINEDYIASASNPYRHLTYSTKRDVSPRKLSPDNTQQQLPASESSKLKIGILGGPDLSTVDGISNFYDPGYNIGLSVEYFLTDNLAISVGAVHSKVQYSASGSKYNPPQNYWSYGTLPDETVGRCLLIDIPIKLKYNFLNFDRSRLFATAGASSYIMLNEEYQFEYGSYSSGQPQQWQENTGTRHWMSNATFSLGYEVDLNQKLSLRAEPFIKVPMREVGWANVKLYSMGSLISVNYNL